MLPVILNADHLFKIFIGGHRPEENQITHDDDDNPAMLFNAEYFLRYRLMHGLFTEHEQAQFARVNGVHNAWPYLREWVQTTCARMLIQPIILHSHVVEDEDERAWPHQACCEGDTKNRLE